MPTPNASLYRFAACVMCFTLGCASESTQKVAPPAAAETPATITWSDIVEVQPTPWRALPPGPADAGAFRQPAWWNLSDSHAEEVEVNRSLALPAGAQCQAEYWTSGLEQETRDVWLKGPQRTHVVLRPHNAGIDLVCGERRTALLAGRCSDAFGRSAPLSPVRLRAEIPSAAESRVMAALGVHSEALRWISDNIGVEPRAFITELARRSSAPECLSHVADEALFVGGIQAEQKAFTEAHPRHNLRTRRRDLTDKLRWARSELGAPLQQYDVAALQRELDDVERELEALGEADTPSSEAVARWLPWKELETAYHGVVRRTLKVRARPPTMGELRVAARSDPRFVDAVNGLPDGEVATMWARSWLDPYATALSPYVRVRFDGTAGHDHINAPTRPPGWSTAPSAAPGNEAICGTCRASADCGGDLVCTTDLVREGETITEGHCTRLVARDETWPDTCAPSPDLSWVSVALADGGGTSHFRARVCEPEHGCAALNAVSEGKKCSGGPTSLDPKEWYDRTFSTCGHGGMCAGEIDACVLPCDAGACADGTTCESLVIVEADSIYDHEGPFPRADVCVANGVDRRSAREVRDAEYEAQAQADPLELQRNAGKIMNKAGGGFAYEQKDVFGGLDGENVRVFSLDESAQCVAAFVEKGPQDDSTEDSALPVLRARRIQTSVSCRGRSFVPLFSQVCRTVKTTVSGRHLALQPIVLEARDHTFAPLDTVAKVYDESLLAARARVTERSPAPACFEALEQYLPDVVRAAVGQQTRVVGRGEERIAFPLYGGWLPDDHLRALTAGETPPALTLSVEYRQVAEAEVDELNESLRPSFRDAFDEQKKNAEVLKRLNDTGTMTWRDEFDADAALAGMILDSGLAVRSLRPATKSKAPPEVEPTPMSLDDQVETLLAGEPRWRSLPLVKEALDRLDAWATHRPLEERAHLRYLLARFRRPLDVPRARTRVLHANLVGSGVSAPTGVRALGLSHGDFICDLGQKWPDADPAFTWRVFNDDEPHLFKRDSWSALWPVASKMSLPIDTASLCRQHFRPASAPLPRIDEVRFAKLEAKRLGSETLSAEEAAELGELGTRFAYATPPPEREHARQRLLRAHARSRSLQDDEKARFFGLVLKHHYFSRIGYATPALSDEKERTDHRKFGFRFAQTERTAPLDAALASLDEGGLALHGHIDRCLTVMEKVRGVSARLNAFPYVYEAEDQTPHRGPAGPD